MDFVRSLTARIAFVALVAFVGGVFAPFALAETLEQLEQVLRKAKDFDEFMARPKLQDEYFQALQDYLGKSKVDRKSYNAILFTQASIKALRQN